MRARNFPFVWVTWISGLLSGDKQCEFSAWFRAQFQEFETAPGDPEKEARLAQWKAEHAEVVRRRAAEYEALWLRVKVEDQNKFTIKGATALLSGTADLCIAFPKGVEEPHNVVGLVEDVKTGKSRGSDWWQVLLYMWALPRAFKGLPPLNGRLYYPKAGSSMEIPLEELTPARVKKFTDLMRAMGDKDQEPKRVPSPNECRDCPISRAHCSVRDDAPIAEAVTTEF